MNKFNNRLILALVVVSGIALLSPAKVYASYGDCEENYGGGETCIINKSFKIEKEVRIEGDKSWKDKVTDVEKDETVEFKITIENVGDLETDGMKMEDFLPKEMFRTGGDGLTESWDNFAPGDKVTFVIEAKIDEDEFDRENFEKCVVNKAELTYKGDFEGADTATVCYGDEEPTELPKTGPESNLLVSLIGMGLTATGILIKKSRK